MWSNIRLQAECLGPAKAYMCSTGQKDGAIHDASVRRQAARHIQCLNCDMRPSGTASWQNRSEASARLNARNFRY